MKETEIDKLKRILEEEKARYLTSEYTDEMKQDYIDYAMSVIVARALPDVRDGLKPVHRRIMWAMEELKNYFDKPHRKCARIVGDVLGKYHPHGDTAVYDALVRMAQDFRMGTILVDGHGNFGSVDGDSAAAMRYCLVGNTIISTNKGLLKIKDIVSNSELNSDTDIELTIKSFGHKTNEAIKFFNSGVHPVKEVVTKLGYSVKGSYNHPVLTLTTDEGGKPIFCWKTIDSIKLGDYLVIDRSLGTISSDIDYVSENEAKFLGGLVSEGYISPKYNKVCFTNSDTEFVNEMETWFKELFTDENIIKYDRQDGCWDVYMTTKKVNEIKEKYNYGDYSEYKTVPDLILRSSLKTQSLFLRYLFEGDGSVEFEKISRLGRKKNKNYERVNTYITYTSKSLTLIKQIQVMLLQYGIYSSISPDRDCYRVIISSKQNIKLFYENIGFAYERKQEILTRAYESTKNESGFVSLGNDQIPYLKDFVLNTCSKKTVGKYGFTNRSKYEKNKSKLEKWLSKDTIDLIDYLHSLNYVYVPVTEIGEAGSEVVYSMKVDSKCHSFVANGIINHNTEARLAPMAMEMLKDLDKNVVDFKENFDGTEKEPSVLPAKLPNLLINGSQGIAVGMATNIPPHNTSEVIDAVTAYIDNPKIDIEGLLEYIKGPDYPSGASIINQEEMLEFYRTGKGKVVMRPKMQIENAGYGRTNIVITEIPFTCSGGKTKMIADIIDRMNDKTLDDIVDVRDESSREGIRIVLEVKKGADIENEVLPAIYKKTKLQDQDSLNFLVLINKEPKVINLKDYISHYVEFQKEITKRKYEYLLRKAEERREVLEGLVRATDVIDVIIEALRGSKEQKTVKDCLMFGKTENINFKTKKSEAIAKKFDFTERQTNAILDRRLLSLLSLEVEKLIQEFEACKKEIQEYTEIITSEKKQLSVIKKYLKELRAKFDTPRKTEITTVMVKEYKKKFKEEDLYLVVDKFGYTKTLDTTSIGRSSEDKISEFRCNILSKNTDKMAVFTNKGNLYQIKNTEIPKGKIKDKGVPIETLCGMDKNEYPIYITTSSLLKDTTAVFLSKSGLIKRTDCNEFESTRKVIASTKFEGEDELLDIKIVEDGLDEVAVVTKQGYILKFPIESIPVMKKASKGVKSIEMSVDSDTVDQLHLMPMEVSLVVDVNGKDIDLSKVKMKDRANKGIKA